jgi:hypothetical protein
MQRYNYLNEYDKMSAEELTMFYNKVPFQKPLSGFKTLKGLLFDWIALDFYHFINSIALFFYQKKCF